MKWNDRFCAFNYERMLIVFIEAHENAKVLLLIKTGE